MASNVQKKLLKKDLHYLEELAQLLHTELDEKIKKILIDGKNWLCHDMDVQTRQSYEDVKRVTESAISFVSEICQQIGDNWDQRTQKKVPDRTETRKSTQSSADFGDITSLTTQMRAMEEKMTSLSQIVERLTSHQDLTESSVNDMSSKCSQLEDDVKIKSDHINNTIQEISTDMGRVQTDIERTRNHIQDLENIENETQRHMAMVTEMVQNHEAKLTALRNRSVVGFNAHFPSRYHPVWGRPATGYEKVTGNRDGSFCKDSGIFTVPVKGMYGVCFRQWQWGSGDIGIDVIKTSQSYSSAAATSTQDISKEKICFTQTWGNGESDFCLVVREMEVGDTLSVVPFHVTQNASLGGFSIFSVFLIS